MAAAALRIPLLWDDPWAPGYDGGYYVLQVRSWLDGAPIFADDSWVFPVLALFARVCGDVVLGNKVAATAFAAATAGLAGLAGLRWTGSRHAALVMGVWVACSPLHLGVSAEFLKNACGLVVLMALVAALAGRPRGWLVAGLVLLGGMVHKLTGALGVVLVVGVLAGRGRAAPILAGLAGLGALGLGVLRPVDLQRFGGEGIGRMALIDGPLSTAESIEAVLVHAAPLTLLAVSRSRGPFVVGLFLVSLATLAPGLPFGWDLTSWRLVLMGFIPLAACAALVAEAAPWATGFLIGAAVLQGPSSAEHQATREPDYATWSQHLQTVKDTVPPDHRVVAHRGLCGYIWAAGDRVCENFQPQGDLEGWWRVGFGMGQKRLEPYCRAVPLAPGYVLVPEVCWQAFRADHVDRFSLLRDDRNPYQPRPAFVYGPEGDTPQP